MDAWRSRVGEQHHAALVRAFEHAFCAVWGRARLTLGDITLTAIGDRVLYDSADRYPVLRGLALQPSGVSCEDLARDAGSVDPGELDEALQLVLVGLLTVLGRLTADVLTPMLHAELDADRFIDEVFAR